MNERASDPLTEVDDLVRAYLTKETEQIDGTAGLARVRTALESTPKPKPRANSSWRRRGIRVAVAASIAATIAVAFFSGWYLNPVQASVRELVEEVKRTHNQPLARCYLVEVQRITDADEDAAPLGKVARQVHLWTYGDRFWVEMQRGEATLPFIWGRGDNGSLWAVLDAQRGLRVPLEQAPKPLQRIAELYTLNLDTLLGDVLQDCTLTDDQAAASKLTRVVSAEPRSDRTRRWLGKATLEIDTEAKVLRRMAIVRNVLGKPLAQVTFTLIETQPADSAQFQLEGHLAEPTRIYEGNIEPKVKLELLGRWFGARNERPAASSPALEFKDVDGRVQTPLSQVDKKATVLFFIIPDCPICNAYAPEIKRICADFERKKIAMYVIHADPDVTVEQAKKHAAEYGLACSVLLDPTHVLVKKTGVTLAPEVAVCGPDGKVLYRGRIDDWYADTGKRRGEPTQRDLRRALDAILQGNEVTVPTTKAIGCYLPDPK